VYSWFRRVQVLLPHLPWSDASLWLASMRGRSALGWVVLLACAVAAQAAVERAIFTARELERRIKLNSYVLGVGLCNCFACMRAVVTWGGPRPANVRTAWLAMFLEIMRASQSDQMHLAPLHTKLCIDQFSESWLSTVCSCIPACTLGPAPPHCSFASASPVTNPLPPPSACMWFAVLRLCCSGRVPGAAAAAGHV
jgi:hypothetical protein